MAEVHPADPVVRIRHRDLDAFEHALEEQLRELRSYLRVVPAGRDSGLDVCAQRAQDQVMVVVAGDEDHALPLELLPYQLEERLRLLERPFHPSELDVEDVAEEDELVDVVEVWREPLARKRPGQQPVGGPGAEMEVGDDQYPHAS